MREETRERIRETTPAVRKIVHTIEYLDLVRHSPPLRARGAPGV
ncbi:hypothetical protein [Streptomyces fuscichromogenes]|uniref:Uncharacterized protein n=1 Tax=Streptomyces fuscichromogenes TaxID=1324013 RepID=A0A918CXI4_9ACTN|nr:hypothetical protein [Streptomyces fuscichromogenes]GGN45564.1 hypothetical protein GCM10011578_097640 [Streptomyces fuscichromogenes]